MRLCTMGSTYALNGIVMSDELADESGIPPGYMFDYKPNISDQVGTYWMHTHVPGQYPDGLRSPLIVRDPTPPNNYTYQGEGMITVSDWVVILWLATNHSTIEQ